MTLDRVAAAPVDERHAYHLAHRTWSPTPDAEIHITLPADHAAPSDARRAASDLLAAHTIAEQLADTALMLSELVTNALRHPVVRATTSIELHVAVSSERIRAEISDAGAGFPASRLVAAGPDAVGGRGLLIIDSLASRWGTSTEHGHTVWFEVDR